MACFFTLTGIAAFGQTTTSSFRYAIPEFNSITGSELVISNLSNESAQGDVRFFSASGAELSNVPITVAAGTQARLASTSFSKGTQGTAVVQSSKPLSVTGTIAHENGSIENVAATSDWVSSIVPFYLGGSSRMEVTISNGNSLPTTALIRAFASDGTVLGSVERPVPPSGSITETVGTMFPQFTSASARELSYLGILAEASVLTEERRLHVQARIRDYSDPALLAATTASAASLNPVLPFFVQGGDFVTTIQVVNPSASTASVSLIAYDPEGRILSVGSSVQLPPNGATRNTAQNLLNIGAGMTSGSIVFRSNVPILVTGGIAHTAQNAFVLTSAVSAETGVAFSQRKGPSQSDIGLTIVNQNASSARVRLRSIRSDGTPVAQVSVVVNAFASLTRSFDEFFSDNQIDGFIYISSDVPVFVSALESSTNSKLLANVPGMRPGSGYNPPSPVQFRIKGTVRRTGGTVAGVKIQLGGALNIPLFTDTSGAYIQRVSPGQYTIEPSDASYIFFPPLRTITITQDDSVGNDFEASLIGPTPKPTLLSISPSSTDLRLGANTTPLFLTATGSNFVPGAKLYLDNVEVQAQFFSSTSLTASIPANLLQVGGTIQVSVQNPAPSLGASASVPLSVNNPAPILTSIDPVTVTMNPSAPVSVTLQGENFAPTSIFEVTPPCASIFGTNRISAESGLLSINLQCAGTYYVRVRTPQPGGGTSQTLPFTVR